MTTPTAAPSDAAPAERAVARQETVLVHAHDPVRCGELVELIRGAGWQPLVADTPDEVISILNHARTDLFLMTFSRDDGGELEVLSRVRADVAGADVPIVCLLDRPHRRITIEAFGRRADDVVVGRHHSSVLIARLRARIERPSVPRIRLAEDPVTGALTPDAFTSQLHKEQEHITRGGNTGALALLSFDELPAIAAVHGSRGRDEVLAQVVKLIKADGRRLDFVGSQRDLLAILLPNTPMKGAQARFDRLIGKLYETEFTLAGSPIRLTPLIGFVATAGDLTIDELEDRAWDALRYQSGHLDLHPTAWVPAMSDGPRGGWAWFERVRTPFQVTVQQLAVLGVPLLAYYLLDAVGVDVTSWVYLAIVVALAVTAAAILLECRAAVDPRQPPEAPPGPPPLASAIIAAYLPNEAPTIVETVEAFLTQDYPLLEIILAYNTPTPLDVEDELRAIAERDPRFTPLRIHGSVSKAQNVNAALAVVKGEFVGLFDADHHPAPGSFHRAWRWLAGGAGVVQGHCVVRNGDTNLVTRLVAAEFESIYAVSHPGRARLHRFGIFGGSNGYWHTSLLHRTRMRGSMLTEDIDSSMRVVRSGRTIISDPHLVSTELAPDTWGALWNQRLRWAQGWSQVSIRHLAAMVRGAPTLRQRLGVMYLLGWREIYPWISLQMIPLLCFWWLQGNPPTDWFVPIFVVTSLFTLSSGPIQIWYSYRLAHPSIRAERRWFATLLVASLLFYAEWKNVVGRTAQLKEMMRERKWKVTPRTGAVAVDTASVDATPVEPAPVEPVESAAVEPVAVEPAPVAARAEAAAPAPAPAAPLPVGILDEPDGAPADDDDRVAGEDRRQFRRPRRTGRGIERNRRHGVVTRTTIESAIESATGPATAPDTAVLPAIYDVERELPCEETVWSVFDARDEFVITSVLSGRPMIAAVDGHLLRPRPLTHTTLPAAEAVRPAEPTRSAGVRTGEDLGQLAVRETGDLEPLRP